MSASFRKSPAADHRIKIPLDKKERIFGLGDATREKIMIRGMCADMHVENVISYGPMAVMLSDSGWAFMLDSTYRSFIDCAKTDPDSIVIDVTGGKASFFLFRADSLKGLVGLITKGFRAARDAAGICLRSDSRSK